MLASLVRRSTALAIAALFATAPSAHGALTVTVVPDPIDRSDVNGGATAHINITGGFPGGSGFLGFSFAGNGPTGSACGAAIELAPPLFLFPVPFTASGTASIPITQIPASLDLTNPMPVHLQALSPTITGSCMLSAGKTTHIVD